MQKTSNMFCLFCQYLFSNKGGSNIHSHQPSTVPRTKNAGGGVSAHRSVSSLPSTKKCLSGPTVRTSFNSVNGQDVHFVSRPEKKHRRIGRRDGLR